MSRMLDGPTSEPDLHRDEPPTAIRHGNPVAAERHRRYRRRSVVSLILLSVLVLGVLASLAFGQFVIPMADVVPGLFGQGKRSIVFVLQTLRLPRTLAAVLVGAALAVSGSIFQVLTRNPLASPDILGITGAAGLGAAYAILVLSVSGPSVALCAGLAALVAAGLIYWLSWRRGTNGYRLILVGIGIAAIATALTSWLLTQRQALEAERALIWITGSLNDVSTPELSCLAIVCAVGFVIVPLVQRRLNTLEFGDQTATALGARPETTRAVAVLIAVALAAAAVAVAGPVTFIALVAPPIARRLVRTPGVVPLVSALVGALLVLGSDTAAHDLLANQPVGVVTGIVGAPYLIFLLTRRTT